MSCQAKGLEILVRADVRPRLQGQKTARKVRYALLQTGRTVRSTHLRVLPRSGALVRLYPE